MTRHDEGTIGERAKPKGKKKVSPARNAVAAVLLVSISMVAYLEWSANRRSAAAISKLNETLGREEGDLLSMKEVEDLIGRKPDGPVVEENGALKVTYTWKGVFRQYPLIAIYRKQSPPKLLRIGMADGEGPPAVKGEHQDAARNLRQDQADDEAWQRHEQAHREWESKVAAWQEARVLRERAESPVRGMLARGGVQKPDEREIRDAPLGVETVKLRPFASGATARVGGYMPQLLRLNADRPADLAKAPELAAPLFGVIALGPRESPARVVVALDELEGQPSRLYIDANANGDLTDDPAPVWTSSTSKSQDGRTLTMFQGNASIMLALGGEPIPARFYFYRFDRNDPTRTAFKETLFFYADYGFEGEITLGDYRYKALLVDRLATGDFRGKAGAGFSGVQLMIDVNRNGRFDRRGESYDVRKPFNIKGTTYEIAGLTASGGEFQIRTSDTSVAEILPPPDLSPGQKAIRFTARTTDDQEVSFPSSYAGKLVLLDFWATWCGPCIAELPHLTKAYDRFHDHGFEVLGISLDQPNSNEKVASFTRAKHMPWRQVYDGKFWQAEVATLYAVDSIPRAYLVDGDTGEILAAEASLRGERLGETIATALRRKGLLKRDATELETGAVPMPASVTALLKGLRDAGNVTLANELVREIDQARAAVARDQQMSPSRPAHVIVGRVVGEGLDDASRVITQMMVHREGYFVAAVGASGRPLGFRMQGYLPVEITPTGEPGSVEDVGEVRLTPVSEAMQAGVKGTLVVERATGAPGAIAKLTVAFGPINIASGGFRSRALEAMELTLADSGTFSASGLSPMVYFLTFQAPGAVSQTRSAALKPGETLDLGMIRLERPRRITVSYREAPSPPFTHASPGRQTILGGGQFKAGNPRFGYDLRFDQRNGKIVRFGVYGSCQIADLGPGNLDDFLQVDPTSVQFVFPATIVPQPGHVYLLDQKVLKHSVLFRFEEDAAPSELELGRASAP